MRAYTARIPTCGPSRCHAPGRGLKRREEAPLRRLPTYLESLSHRDFLTLWTASMSAGAAAWALIIARGWLVWAETESSLWVGLVTFAAMIPRVLVTPFTGYLSDRFDRRVVVAAMFAHQHGSQRRAGLAGAMADMGPRLGARSCSPS